jgi:RHS repeat-associated protein
VCHLKEGPIRATSHWHPQFDALPPQASIRKRCERLVLFPASSIGDGRPIFLITGSDYEDSRSRVVASAINRYYDPTTDQFLSIDPKVASTNQPYVFTNDNPLNSTDPMGLSGGAIYPPGPCKKNCGPSITHMLKSVVNYVAKHPGDVVTVLAIGVCIAGSGGLCAGATVVAFASRVTQRSGEGVPVISSTNLLDAFMTGASFGLLSVPTSIGERALANSPVALYVFRIHSALPDIFGWTVGEVSHRDVP